MTQRKKQLSLLVLWLTVGAVAMAQALVLALGSRAAAAFAHTGLPDVVRVLLAWGEVAAAALFLIPPTVRLGGWLLLAAFAAAAVLHVTHGRYDISGLFVYAAGVLVVMTHRPGHLLKEAAVRGGPHDG
jgi:hypothetical protein